MPHLPPHMPRVTCQPGAPERRTFELVRKLSCTELMTCDPRRPIRLACKTSFRSAKLRVSAPAHVNGTVLLVNSSLRRRRTCPLECLGWY